MFHWNLNILNQFLVLVKRKRAACFKNISVLFLKSNASQNYANKNLKKEFEQKMTVLNMVYCKSLHNEIHFHNLLFNVFSQSKGERYERVYMITHLCILEKINYKRYHLSHESVTLQE